MATRSRPGTRAWMLMIGLTVLASAGWATQATYVYAPNDLQSAEGNSDNIYPLSGDPMRYQQVFSATTFPGGRQWITQIALRPDGVNGQAFQTTIADIQVNLSTTAKATDALSTTFAENVGDDDTIVFQGALSLASAATGPAGGPMDFDIVIDLATPFLYDPAAGNLLLDIRNASGGTTTLLDAEDSEPDITSRVWSVQADSDTADDNDSYPSCGLVIRFTTAPAP